MRCYSFPNVVNSVKTPKFVCDFSFLDNATKQVNFTLIKMEFSLIRLKINTNGKIRVLAIFPFPSLHNGFMYIKV